MSSIQLVAVWVVTVYSLYSQCNMERWLENLLVTLVAIICMHWSRTDWKHSVTIFQDKPFGYLNVSGVIMIMLGSIWTSLVSELLLGYVPSVHCTLTFVTSAITALFQQFSKYCLVCATSGSCSNLALNITAWSTKQNNVNPHQAFSFPSVSIVWPVWLIQYAHYCNLSLAWTLVTIQRERWSIRVSVISRID